MGRSRYKMLIPGKQPYFLTCAVINWINIFGHVEIAKIILDSLDFLIRKDRLALHGFVIMDNHLHLIASSANLTKEIGLFKSYTARCIVDFFKENHFDGILKQFHFYKKQHKTDQEYQVWEEGSHPEAIIDEKMLNQKLDYIHYNPIRKGYVEDPAHWRYSSFKNYMGEEGLLPIEIIG